MGWFLVKSCCLTFVIYLDARCSAEQKSGRVALMLQASFSSNELLLSSPVRVPFLAFPLSFAASSHSITSKWTFRLLRASVYCWTRILTPCEQEMSCDFSRDGLTDASLRKKLDHIESHRYVTTKNAWITTCEIPITHCFFITWNTVKYFKLGFRILL